MDFSKAVTKSGTPIKLLIGGSPCTKWSIAQKNGREVLPEGIGWELFENYRIAKEKFQPDFFLYENNKSAAQPIKDAIYSALGGDKDSSVRLTHINSALVSAQNRQRFYVTNFGDIEQPKDRGILLKDILENGADLMSNDKSFALTATYDGAVAQNTLEKQIPKKPKYEDVDNVYGAIKRTCTACGDVCMVSKGAKPYEHYCRQCGQALDWSENND